MNDKLRRIDPLIRRAEERKEAVAREFAAKNRLLATHEQRLGDLLRYSDEYARLDPGLSFGAAQLANREAFRNKLGEAVQAQRQQVEQVRSSAELERVRLTMASRDSKVVERLAEGYRAEMRRIEETHQQKRLDEFAIGAHHRRQRAEED